MSIYVVIKNLNTYFTISTLLCSEFFQAIAKNSQSSVFKMSIFVF